MEQPAYIYALTEPETGYVRYVGKADNPQERYRKHMLPSALAIRCRRTSWLRGLLNKNQRPGMVILEAVSQDRWKERECYWMAFYRALGCNLVNTAQGGSGGVLPEWVTPEAKAKMSAAQMGKKRDPDAIRRMAEKRVGVPRAPETIAKMSAAHKGKKPSVQCEEARLKAITGSTHSDETKAKMSQAHKGNQRAKKHDYIVTDPDGGEYKVESLAEFCKLHGLCRAHMSKVANGHKYYQQHKGWRCRFRK